jgi:hypothetical protein
MMQVIASATGSTEQLPTLADLERAKVAFYFADEEWGRDTGNEEKWEEFMSKAMALHLIARALDVEVHTELQHGLFMDDEEAFREWLTKVDQEAPQDGNVVEEDPWGSDPRVREATIAGEQESGAAAWSESNR